MFKISLQVHTGNKEKEILRSSDPVDWDFIPFVGMKLEIERAWDKEEGELRLTTKVGDQEVALVTVKKVIYKALRKFFHVEAVTFNGEEKYKQTFGE